MDLNRVAIFVRVVEEGGFTAAARALGLPKSSVSRAVSLLERELGARLLLRSTRAVTPTEAGAAFLAGAGPGLEAIAEAREAVVDLESSLRGTVRLTAPVDAGLFLLAPLIARFGEQHPEVLVDVILTGRVVDLVEEGVDLALRAGPVRDESLIARPLRALPFGLYASRAYLAAHGTPRRVADLAAHRTVLFRAPTGRTTWRLRGPRGEESVDVKGALVVDDFGFVREALVSGAGVGLVPSFVAEGDAASNLARVLPRHHVPGAQLSLAYAGSRYLPRRVGTLRDFLVEALGAPPKRGRRAP